MWACLVLDMHICVCGWEHICSFLMPCTAMEHLPAFCIHVLLVDECVLLDECVCIGLSVCALV